MGAYFFSLEHFPKFTQFVRNLNQPELHPDDLPMVQKADSDESCSGETLRTQSYIGLGTLWIIYMTSWDMRVVTGLPNILVFCGHMMVEKSSLVKHTPNDWLQLYHGDGTRSVDKIHCAKLMPTVARFKDDAVVCEAGVLGLPYWLSFPLERVSISPHRSYTTFPLVARNFRRRRNCRT